MRLKLSKLNHAIIAIILLEIFLGGSGRMIEIGSLTLRMYFFVFGLILSLIVLFYKKNISINVVYIVSLSILSISFSTLLGFINGASLELIALDIKPLLFIFFIISAYTFINTEKDILLISKLLKFAAIVLSISYLIILYLLYFKHINFEQFWLATYDYHEFFFRGEEGFFTYKGFIYMGIGFIFWERLSKPGFKKILSLGLLTVAIILTGTRGFLVVLGLIYFFYLVVPKLLKGNLIYLIGIIALVFLSVYFIGNTNLGDKAVSDMIRFSQLNEVVQEVNIFSLVVGHGFGNGVPSRPVHMEIAFLEIFHKQGLIGIILWLCLIAHIVILYLNLNKHKKIAQPFILSTFFVLILSITNPYMNNPIGLTMIIITIIVLDKIKRNDINENISLPSHI